MPAAAKALFMNSYWNMSVMMLVAAMAVIVVVQMVGHLHDGAEHRLAVAEIEHAVERAEQLIELMRAKQHGDLALAADLAHHVDRHLLMACVEADQRLIEQ